MRKVPISLIANVTAGQGAPKPDEFSDNGIPFVRAGSLEDLLAGVSELDLERVPVETAKKRKLKLYPKGSILFAKSGMSATKNRIYVLQNPAYVVSHLAILTSKENIHWDYLRLALKQFPPSSLIKDPAYPAIGLVEIQGYEIPVPDEINDQKRIAHLLGKVEGLIARRKQHLQQLDDLLKSIFLEMFGDPVRNEKGWDVQLLENLCHSPKDIKCGPFGTQLSKSEFKKSGVPVWGIPQINSEFSIPPNDFVTKEKADQLEEYCVRHNDIVMSRKGTVGKCSLYPPSMQQGIMHSDVLRIRADWTKTNPVYLCWQLRISRDVEKQIANVSNGAIIAGINVGKLKSINVFTPPIKLQNQFAAIVEKIDSLKSRYQQSLTDLENLYGGLSQKAFKGELDLSRVVLPAEGPEIAVDEEHDVEEMQPMEPMFELPAPDEFAVLHTAEGRKSLLNEWLNAWLGHLGETPFTAQAFMDAARQRLWELMEDDAPDWGVAEYDELKTWVFEALEQGRLTQAYDDANNRLQIIATKGNAE